MERQYAVPGLAGESRESQEMRYYGSPTVLGNFAYDGMRGLGDSVLEAGMSTTKTFIFGAVVGVGVVLFARSQGWIK